MFGDNKVEISRNKQKPSCRKTTLLIGCQKLIKNSDEPPLVFGDPHKEINPVTRRKKWKKKIARCLVNSKTKQSMKQILSFKKTTAKINTFGQHWGVPAKHYGKLG